MDLIEVLGAYRNDIDFVGIEAPTADFVVVRAVVVSMDEAGKDHTVFLVYRDGSWSQRLIPSCTTSFCLDSSDSIYALTPLGAVVHLEGDSFESHPLDTAAGGFNQLRTANEIVHRNGEFYIAGMGREVHQGQPGKKWTRLSDDTMATAADFVGGFLSLDVDQEGLIHAVGFNGEIYYDEGHGWKATSSPTNIRLTRVRSLGNGDLLACGAHGVLLQGKKDKWEIVQQEVTEDNFWDLSYFQGRMYASTSNSLISIDGACVTEDVALPGSPPIRTGFLASNKKALWSVGKNNIALFDGEDWKILV